MAEEKPMLAGAATVFVVSNIAKSIAHYRDALGFTVTFEYGTPIFYACLCRDEVALHLLAARETRRLPGSGLARQRRSTSPNGRGRFAQQIG